ncbi:MAG: Flp family type IVb pilin [Alphaproteobacteria bacterium]|nr:Flp family type IVb pilin [Alphaproteobacteria bacterium]
MPTLRRFASDESAAAIIEYGIVAAILSISIVGGLVLIGANLQTLFTGVVSALAQAVAG